MACDADEPGMPINTEVKVSEVGMTATKPMSSASAEVTSMPYKNGSMMEKPTMPPKPGNTPMLMPSNTPPTKCSMCCKVSRLPSAVRMASVTMRCCNKTSAPVRA